MLNLDLKFQDNPRIRILWSGGKIKPSLKHAVCPVEIELSVREFVIKINANSNPSINMKLMTRAKISPVEIGLTYIRAFVIKR